MSLRERCQKFLQTAQQDAILRQGSPVDDLMTFVISEMGRAAAMNECKPPTESADGSRHMLKPPYVGRPMIFAWRTADQSWISGTVSWTARALSEQGWEYIGHIEKYTGTPFLA